MGDAVLARRQFPVWGTTATAGLTELARRAVRDCPRRALTLERDRRR